MEQFDKTPSFYNNENTFKKYLGETSYYKSLQNSVMKLISLCNAKKVVELGSALGNTLIKCASTYPSLEFMGYDIRSHVVDAANVKRENLHIDNVLFAVGDMTEVVLSEIDADVVYMLYSFHHIEDPLDKKVTFLRHLFNNIPTGCFVCIAETFLPMNGFINSEITEGLWKRRNIEAYSSTFWASLEGISEDKLNLAKSIGEFSADYESAAGKLVVERSDEYLVEVEWLEKVSKDVGFKIVLSEPINTLGEHIILLQK